MAKVVKEMQEPMAGPDVVRHDDFISQHEDAGHKHHKHTFKAHGAGHEFEMDKVAKMCGGGKVKK